MCKSACVYALLFLYTVKRGMASSLANSCVLFEGASKLFANCAILYPNSNAWGTLGFHIFPTFIIACLFLLWPLVGMKCCLIVFLICIPQMTNAFEHFYVLYIFEIKDIHCRKLKISRKSKGKKIPLCFHNLSINTVMLWCSYFSCVCVYVYALWIHICRCVCICVGACDMFVKAIDWGQMFFSVAIHLISLDRNSFLNPELNDSILLDWLASLLWGTPVFASYHVGTTGMFPTPTWYLHGC